MEDYKKFKGIDSFGESLLSEQLQRSTKMFLDWAFLGIGAFHNVANPSTTIYSGNLNKLTPVKEQSTTNYKIWQSAKMEWIYETNTNWTTAPNTVSVKVDGTTYSSSHGTYGHYINYPLGRVVFNNALASNKVVTASYAYRRVGVSILNDADWFRELQQRSFRVEDSQFTQISTGEWSIGGNHRVQMPHVVISQIPNGYGAPWELGSGGLKMTRNLAFHVFAETDWERDKIVDILSYQQSLAYYLLDFDSIAKNGHYPLDSRGMLVNTPKTYSELADLYPVNKVYVVSHKLAELQFPAMYTGIVRWQVEIDGVG